MKRVKVFLFLLVGTMLAGCELLPEIPVSPPTEAPTVSPSFGEFRDSIGLSWQSVPGATTYKIFRTENPEAEYTQIDEVASPAYSDGVGEENQGKWYWYKVRACNAAGCGPWSAAVRGYAGRPPKPAWVEASDGAHPDMIRVEWDFVPGATYYQLFRDPGPDPDCRGLCILDAEVKANLYEDRSVRAGARYDYAVRACNRYGCSELSDIDSGCVEPCPLPLSPDAE